MWETGMVGGTMGVGHGLWMLIIGVVLVIPVWRLCQRAGYPGVLGVLILIPLVNLALLYFLAFAEWPAEKSRSQNHD